MLEVVLDAIEKEPEVRDDDCARMPATCRTSRSATTAPRSDLAIVMVR